MFGFLKKKSKTEETVMPKTQQYAPAPGTQISYHPELIASLKSDHLELLAIYAEISELFGAKKYPQVSEKLANFRAKLQDHLLTENVRLYIYLNYMLKHDETNSELIHSFRREMDGIAKVAINFLKKYDAIGVDPELAPSFAKDFSEIGTVLGKRIKREEEVLYPLYMESYAL